MPTVPVRGVGGVGVISDIASQDAPAISWTDAMNVRFSDGVMSRYSVFKRLDSPVNYGLHSTLSRHPTGCCNGWSTGEGGLVVVTSSGFIAETIGATTTTVSPIGTLAPSDKQPTFCTLGGLTYINQESNVPCYREQPSSGRFQALNGWSAADRCASLRSFKDFLIAIHVTKAGVEYPAMVKWSDAAQVGQPPSNWDSTLPSSMAGENIINDVSGPLIDGLTLGDSFMIYGNYQTFRMDYIGQPYIFRFQKLFDDQGVMSKNCVVEVDGRHYVFGRTDIFAHDGMTKTSIVNTRVSRKLFSEIDENLLERCFVYHDRKYGEIVFCYPSNDDTAAWRVSDTYGCNKGAVYNYRFNTWTFIDLPGIVGATEVSVSVTRTWVDFTDSWNRGVAAWSSLTNKSPKHLVVVGAGNEALSKGALPYYVDPLIGGALANPVDMSVMHPAFALSESRDLDELNMPLLGRKVVTRIVPQCSIKSENSSYSMSVGMSKNPGDSTMWLRSKLFSSTSINRYDCRASGQYVSIRVDIPSGSHVEFSGYDITVEQLSGR